MDRELLRSGDRALVRFRFLQRPEYLAIGSRFVFREGRTKGEEGKPSKGANGGAAAAAAAAGQRLRQVTEAEAAAPNRNWTSSDGTSTSSDL